MSLERTNNMFEISRENLDQILHGENACQIVEALIQEFMHGELNEPTMDAIRLHVSKCEECMDEFLIEQFISKMLAKCRKEVHASQALKMRIISSFTQIRTTNL